MSSKSSNENVGPQEYQTLLAMAGEGVVIVPANQTNFDFLDKNGNPVPIGVFINYGTANATIVSGDQHVRNPGSERTLASVANIVIPAGEQRIIKLINVKVDTAVGADLWAYYA